VFCTPLAHVHTDECNAPEFYTGGAKLTLAGEADKMTPEALRTAIAGWTAGDVHGAQHGPVALTQVTEMGRVYTTAELEALTAVARAHGLPAYMDGARFANALAALGCTPAEMTWKAGIDAVSVGGTKNGCLGVEAVIFFDPARAWEFELRRKRGAQLVSKHRYLSAQMHAYLEDDLWRRSARAANANAARLAAGLRGVPGAAFAAPCEANMLFVRLPRATHQRLHAAGAVYGLYEGPLEAGAPEEPLLARLVCDGSVSTAQIDRFIEIATG
jgi:threonine aldolase